MMLLYFWFILSYLEISLINFVLIENTIGMLSDSPEEFASTKYDFVIIGGGTAGLTLAARLTEDRNITVGVIEAGQNRLADPNILVPGCRVCEIQLELRTNKNSEL